MDQNEEHDYDYEKPWWVELEEKMEARMIEARNPKIVFRLSLYLKKDLKKVAYQEKMTVSALIRLWLMQRMLEHKRDLVIRGIRLSEPPRW